MLEFIFTQDDQELYKVSTKAIGNWGDWFTRWEKRLYTRILKRYNENKNFDTITVILRHNWKAIGVNIKIDNLLFEWDNFENYIAHLFRQTRWIQRQMNTDWEFNLNNVVNE